VIERRRDQYALIAHARKIILVVCFRFGANLNNLDGSYG
jgi:hypothetical protein